MKKKVTILVGGPNGELTKITGFSEIKSRSKKEQPPRVPEELQNCSHLYDGTGCAAIKEVGRYPKME